MYLVVANTGLMLRRPAANLQRHVLVGEIALLVGLCLNLYPLNPSGLSALMHMG